MLIVVLTGLGLLSILGILLYTRPTKEQRQHGRGIRPSNFSPEAQITGENVEYLLKDTLTGDISDPQMGELNLKRRNDSIHHS